MDFSKKRLLREEVGKQYFKYLEKGDTDSILDLFQEEGMVQSPIYGTKSAKEFYQELAEDTSSSSLKLNTIFENTFSKQVALYFTYTWTLKNNNAVNFDVVDIMEFDDNNRITKLTIIYDAEIARKSVLRRHKQ
ncbi:MAG: nuclear transport factor 2 family protein [Bacteroidota bacterium]|mgnify:CR=1 FL=1